MWQNHLCLPLRTTRCQPRKKKASIQLASAVTGLYFVTDEHHWTSICYLAGLSTTAPSWQHLERRSNGRPATHFEGSVWEYARNILRFYLHIVWFPDIGIAKMHAQSVDKDCWTTAWSNFRDKISITGHHAPSRKCKEGPWGNVAMTIDMANK